MISKMKKNFILLLTLFIVSSCSVEESERFYYVTLPVESVDMPTEFVMGETYQIRISYHKPNSCHGFYGFVYEKNLNVRTIAVQTVVFEDNRNCTSYNENENFEEFLNFKPTNNGTYIFKFWHGKDSNGDDIFLEYEIPVI